MKKSTLELLNSRMENLHEGKVMTLNELLQKVREKRGEKPEDVVLKALSKAKLTEKDWEEIQKDREDEYRRV